jgi:serine palmitoyltransferase
MAYSIEDAIIEITRFVLEVLFVFALIKSSYRGKLIELELNENLVDTTILNFSPAPLVEGEYDDDEPANKEVDFECADYDCFGLKNLHKDEIKKSIMQYGIGTCGPRGFYGTLDVHVELELKTAEMLGTQDSIIYSNSFSCISSVIMCFCKSSDIVYYHVDCCESIMYFSFKVTLLQF